MLLESRRSSRISGGGIGGKNCVFSICPGWCWSPARFNWTSYLHYGGDVRAHGVILFREVPQDIAALGCCGSGFFYVDGDDGPNSAYVLKNRTLTIRVLSDTI